MLRELLRYSIRFSCILRVFLVQLSSEAWEGLSETAVL